MSRLLTAFGLCMLIALAALPAFAAELYEDTATGQIFTKPGEGRVPVSLPSEKVVGLYEDESGMVYSRPGEGRTPVAVAEAAPPAPPEPPKKEEVMAVLPDWMQRTKIGGDFRLRYQYEDTHGAANPRHRARYRLRVGVESKILNSLSVGFGLGSGDSSDNRSTNQTMQDTFSKKPIWIDYAYAKFTPNEWLSISGGRMKIPFWKPKDLVWDEDLNYEGGAVNLTYPSDLPVEPFLNACLFILDESSASKRDPFMYMFQPGIKYNITKDVDLKLAAAYYGFDSVRGSALDNSKGTNTTAGGKLVYNYNSVGVSGELGVKEPLPGYIPYAGVFGDYIRNLDPSVLNTGWQAGLSFGYKDVKAAGDWQFVYNYRLIGRDAFLDTFPDSDFFGGATNVKGHELEFRYGLLKNFNIKFDYYMAREITKNVDEDLFQADLNFAF